MKGAPLLYLRGELYCFRDPMGVRGTGVIAQVTQFSTGWIAVAWISDTTSVEVWPDLDTMLSVHGHLGASEVRWLDPEPEETTAETSQCHEMAKAAASLGDAWQRHDDPRVGRS
jgi:hypothetical protein